MEMRILGSTGAAFGERGETRGEGEAEEMPSHEAIERERVSIGFQPRFGASRLGLPMVGNAMEFSIKCDRRRKRRAKKMTTNRKEKEWMEEEITKKMEAFCKHKQATGRVGWNLS